MVKGEGDDAPLREEDSMTTSAMARDKEGCAVGCSFDYLYPVRLNHRRRAPLVLSHQRHSTGALCHSSLIGWPPPPKSLPLVSCHHRLSPTTHLSSTAEDAVASRLPPGRPPLAPAFITSCPPPLPSLIRHHCPLSSAAVALSLIRHCLFSSTAVALSCG